MTVFWVRRGAIREQTAWRVSQFFFDGIRVGLTCHDGYRPPFLLTAFFCSTLFNSTLLVMTLSFLLHNTY